MKTKELNSKFIFETFEEASNVHKKLFELMRINGVVTYADLYCIIHSDDDNMEILDESYYTHGWTNLWDSQVKPVDGYINGDWVLTLPEPKLINKKENK